MDDLVSIITPAFKAESFISAAVRSVLQQSYQNWEMLIISDDQQDYQSILSRQGISDDRLRFYSTNSTQSGPNVTRNLGLKHASGCWIAPLDADDIYYSKRLEKLVAAASDTGLSLDNVYIASAEDYSQKELVLNFPSGAFFFEQFQVSLVPLLFMFHREHIHSNWDEDINRGADTLFNLRALESAKSANFVNEPLHEYRVHNHSMCHAPGSDIIFIEAYRHTLKRLNSDGLGFKSETFRNKVIHMISEKERINSQFNLAVQNGFLGNYQEYVAEQGLR